MSEFIEPISSYTRQCIKRNAGYISNLERMYGKPVKIAERGNQILVNSGVITAALDIKSIKGEKDFINFVIDNCKKNAAARTKGLDVIV